MIRKKIF